MKNWTPYAAASTHTPILQHRDCKGQTPGQIQVPTLLTFKTYSTFNNVLGTKELSSLCFVCLRLESGFKRYLHHPTWPSLVWGKPGCLDMFCHLWRKLARVDFPNQLLSKHNPTLNIYIKRACTVYREIFVLLLVGSIGSISHFNKSVWCIKLILVCCIVSVVSSNTLLQMNGNTCIMCESCLNLSKIFLHLKCRDMKWV